MPRKLAEDSAVVPEEGLVAQRRAAILRTAQEWHPRAATGFTVTADAAFLEDCASALCWRAEVRVWSVVFTPVDPAQRDMELAPAVELEIPPEPAPVAPPAGFDPTFDRRRAAA